MPRTASEQCGMWQAIPKVLELQEQVPHTPCLLNWRNDSPLNGVVRVELVESALVGTHSGGKDRASTRVRNY